MRCLITSDLHLTDRPADEYRWDIFRWLAVRARAKNTDAIVVLGDLTDRKDNHSAKLVNRVVDELDALDRVCSTYVLRGNHDYDQDPRTPFFRFWRNFITDVMVMHIEGAAVLMVPHRRQFVAADLPLDERFDFIFLHQTFRGAVASNGTTMDGAQTHHFARAAVGDAIVVSGDIHVPQRVGNIYYCGSPHPITFGDSFQPRVLYYNGEALRSISRTTIRKAVVEIGCLSDLATLDVTEGDQVRVVVRLPRSEFTDWDVMRQQVMVHCEQEGLDLFGVELRELVEEEQEQSPVEERALESPAEVLDLYCDDKSVADPYRKSGHKLL